MKKQTFITFLILLFLCASCTIVTTENTPEDNRTDLVPELDNEHKLVPDNDIRQLSNDSLWNLLVFEKGGCLQGNQHVYDGEFGGEGCVMSNSKLWKDFFARDKEELSGFLIQKISEDTAKTQIHTCPYFRAVEGEVAVYGLQNLYGLNWYDFEEFDKFNKQGRSIIDNHQVWLQRVLQSKDRRELLISCWERKKNSL